MCRRMPTSAVNKRRRPHTRVLGTTHVFYTVYVVKGPATPAVLDYLLKLAVLLARSVQCLSVAVSSSPHTDRYRGGSGFHTNATSLCAMQPFPEKTQLSGRVGNFRLIRTIPTAVKNDDVMTNENEND